MLDSNGIGDNYLIIDANNDNDSPSYRRNLSPKRSSDDQRRRSGNNNSQSDYNSSSHYNKTQSRSSGGVNFRSPFDRSSSYQQRNSNNSRRSRSPAYVRHSTGSSVFRSSVASSSSSVNQQRNSDVNYYQRDNRDTSYRRNSPSVDTGLNGRRRSRSRSNTNNRRRSLKSNERELRGINRSAANGGGSEANGNRLPELKFRWDRTVYISNLPLDMRWFDLKDLFRRKVDDVMYCEVYEKDNRSLGFGCIEFREVRDAERAVRIMHGYELDGRHISCRLDETGSRIRQALDNVYKTSSSLSQRARSNDRNERGGYIQSKRSLDQSNSNRHRSSRSRSNDTPNRHQSQHQLQQLPQQPMIQLDATTLNQLAQQILLTNSLFSAPLLQQPQILLQQQQQQPLPSSAMLNNSVTPGWLAQMAAQNNIDGPVTNRLFVSGLDFRVDEAKLQEVFELAGQVTQVRVLRDKDTNRPRGTAIVEFASEFEALNAIFMFNQKQLNDHTMIVKFTSQGNHNQTQLVESDNSIMMLINGGFNGNKPTQQLPTGLKSIGNSIQNGSSLLPTPSNPLFSHPSASNGLLSTEFSNFSSNGLGLLGSLPPNLLANGGNKVNSTNSSIGCIKVLARNVPFTWDERRVREKFRQAGEIDTVELVGKGNALVRFFSHEEAKKAVELLNGSRFDGRTIEVKLDYH